MARTDSEAATLITSTIDHRDHGFILGATNPHLQPLYDTILSAEKAGKTGADLQSLESAWIENAGLKTFDEAVTDSIRDGKHRSPEGLIEQYCQASKDKSNDEARSIASEITATQIYWNWDTPRTCEGYYRYRGGTSCAVKRAVAYAPFADLVWMESAFPDFNQAKEFASGMYEVWPHQK